MVDLYSKFYTHLDDPAERAFAITPTNSAEFAVATRFLYVGGAGSLNVILVGDTANTAFAAVPAGTTLRIRVKTVHSTGTTATSIVGLY